MASNEARGSLVLQALVRDASATEAVLTSMKEELVLFQRTMYKNHSQHRRAAFYKHLQEVQRALRFAAIPDIASIFTDATAVLHQFTLAPGEHHVSWKVLNGELKVQVDAVLRRLASFAEIASKVIVAAQKAFKGLEQQFAMTYFMPFALTTNSILGRIVVLIKALLIRSIEVHGGISLVYLNEATKANPLRARTTALQLSGYSIAPSVIEAANA